MGFSRKSYSFFRQSIAGIGKQWNERDILRKVEELPAKCRAVFKASLYEGKSYSEIAEEQNINVATVRVQMKIALTKLRESLGTPYMIAILMFL